MTADQKKPKSFARALQYNLAKVSSGIAEVLDHSFSELSEKLITKEIQMMRTKRPNLKKFFYHTSINFPLHENLSNEVMKQIANDYLQQSGFTQHQFIVFRHYDAGHPHLHILVNRIGFDGKVISDSNDYARSEKVLRALEIKYKLTQVNSSKQSKRAATKNELEMMKRTNEPSNKMKMQGLIKEVLNAKQKLPISEFIMALHEKGINVRFNQASTGYISGVSYSYNGMTITGSKLGNDFKWTTIKNTIDYRQERDRDLIARVNASIVLIYRNVKEIKDEVLDKMNIVEKKMRSLRSRQNVMHKDLDVIKLDIKGIAGNNPLETLIYVEAQPEMNSGSFLTPKKRRRKRRKRI